MLWINTIYCKITIYEDSSDFVYLRSLILSRIKEEELIAEELKTTGKPLDIIKKISQGKINKFKEENSLLNQNWVMEPKKKVKDVIKELNIDGFKINEFFRIKIGE